LCIHKSISISCAIQQMVSVHFFSHAFVLVSIFLALAIQLACTQHRTTSSLHPYRSCVKHTKRHGLGTNFCTSCRTCSTLYMSDLAACDSMKSMLCMERFKPLCILCMVVQHLWSSFVVFIVYFSWFLPHLPEFADPSGRPSGRAEGSVSVALCKPWLQWMVVQSCSSWKRWFVWLYLIILFGLQPSKVVVLFRDFATIHNTAARIMMLKVGLKNAEKYSGLWGSLGFDIQPDSCHSSLSSIHQSLSTSGNFT